MTKVQLEYDLVRPLTDADASGIADVHSWYGIQRVQLMPSMDKLLVEYDASRLSEKDVEAVLQRFRLPIKRKWAVP
jgi:allophanate hydrolase subunit 1